MVESDSRQRWLQDVQDVPQRRQPPTTASGAQVAPLYTSRDWQPQPDEQDLGYPGQYPFVRGVYPSMYRSRLWTMRQFAGFATPRDTNQRFQFLLEKGQTGLSTAFDLPTLMGLDSDDPRSRDEVGRLVVNFPRLTLSLI